MFPMTPLWLHLSFISQNPRRNIDPFKRIDGSSPEEPLVVVATPPSRTDYSNEF